MESCREYKTDEVEKLATDSGEGMLGRKIII